MRYFVILVVVIGALLLGWYLMQRPIKRRVYVRGLSPFLDDLRRAYGDGSILIARHASTGRFVQFAKYVSEGQRNLHFGFPDAPWSHGFFQDVKVRLDDLGCHPIIRETSDRSCPRFVEVDFIPSIEEAVRIAENVFEVMGIRPDEQVIVTLEGELDMGFVNDIRQKGKAARTKKRNSKSIRKG